MRSSKRQVNLEDTVPLKTHLTLADIIKEPIDDPEVIDGDNSELACPRTQIKFEDCLKMHEDP